MTEESGEPLWNDIDDLYTQAEVWFESGIDSNDQDQQEWKKGRRYQETIDLCSEALDRGGDQVFGDYPKNFWQLQARSHDELRQYDKSIKLYPKILANLADAKVGWKEECIWRYNYARALSAHAPNDTITLKRAIELNWRNYDHKDQLETFLYHRVSISLGHDLYRLARLSVEPGLAKDKYLLDAAGVMLKCTAKLEQQGEKKNVDLLLEARNNLGLIWHRLQDYISAQSLFLKNQSVLATKKKLRSSHKKFQQIASRCLATYLEMGIEGKTELLEAMNHAISKSSKVKDESKIALLEVPAQRPRSKSQSTADEVKRKTAASNDSLLGVPVDVSPADKPVALPKADIKRSHSVTSTNEVRRLPKSKAPAAEDKQAVPRATAGIPVPDQTSSDCSSTKQSGNPSPSRRSPSEKPGVHNSSRSTSKDPPSKVDTSPGKTPEPSKATQKKVVTEGATLNPPEIHIDKKHLRRQSTGELDNNLGVSLKTPSLMPVKKSEDKSSSAPVTSSTTTRARSSSARRVANLPKAEAEDTAKLERKRSQRRTNESEMPVVVGDKRGRTVEPKSREKAKPKPMSDFKTPQDGVSLPLTDYKLPDHIPADSSSVFRGSVKKSVVDTKAQDIETPTTYIELEEAIARLEAAGDQALTPILWFVQLRKWTHKTLMGYHDSKRKEKEHIKIAVIDSGLNRERMDVQKVVSQFKDFRDFTSDDHEYHDTNPDEHGTNCASLLARVAPKADIYIANVVPQKSGSEPSVDAICTALAYAADTWDVDIVSMSCGFIKKHDELQRAINETRAKRKLIIVAAPNKRFEGPKWMIFPAFYSSVLTINAWRPSLARSGNELYEDKSNIIFPGERVTIIGNDNKQIPNTKQLDGTSFATPLAAGTAALIFDLLISSGFKKTSAFFRHLLEPENMSIIYRFMSHELTQNQLCYNVKPWIKLGMLDNALLQRDEDVPDANPSRQSVTLNHIHALFT